MSVLSDLVKPWKAFRNRQEVEKKLRKRETIDVEKYSNEMRALRVERDMEIILSKYMDSDARRGVTVKFPEDCLRTVTSILERQGFEYTILDTTRITFRS